MEVATGGDDPRSSVEGATNGYAWRMLVSGDDEAAVLARYTTDLESDGWTPGPSGYAYITMMDGVFTANSWRRGDLVLGLGFPDRDHLFADYPAGTLYELTITFQPADE